MMAQTNEKLSAAMKELAKMRDEVRVKIHLAGMEAKSTWAQLEPRLKEVELKLQEAGSAAFADVGESLEKLGGQLKALRDKLTDKKA